MFLRSAYFLANGGVRSNNPKRSWSTSTCPSQYGPLPIQIVGIESSSVMVFATSAAVNSITIANTPAFSSSFASLIIFSISFLFLPLFL